MTQAGHKVLSSTKQNIDDDCTLLEFHNHITNYKTSIRSRKRFKEIPFDAYKLTHNQTYIETKFKNCGNS